MEKSSKLSSLVKNVQCFIKQCREKNEKLLILSSLEDNEELYVSGTHVDGKTNLDNIYNENSSMYSLRCSGEYKYDIDKNFDCMFSKELNKQNTADSLCNISDYTDIKHKNKIIKFKEIDNANRTLEVCKQIMDVDKNTLRLKNSKEKINDRKINDFKSQIVEYDLDLLKIYNKLKTSAKKNKLHKAKKTSNKLRPYNSEILNAKNRIFLRKYSSFKKKNSMKTKKVEKKNEIQINLLKDTEKLNSKDSYLSYSKKVSKFQYIGSSKKTLDEFFFFQEGLSNRFNKKNSTSPYNIGGMYMLSDINVIDSKDLHKKKTNEILNSPKTTKNFKISNENKINMDYYKQMIESLEETVRKTKKKNNSYIDDIIKVINCLLNDYVPKLIYRYEYYINTLDGKNKTLKQKIKESLDFGDIQYEEIRELKAQIIQKNNQNKKLNDTIKMLKDKLSYLNELELKNAEYLDEIVLFKNRTIFLEKIIEDNDQTKESLEIRKMRRNLKSIYKKMKNEMRYISILKLKYLKKYRKRKFSINKWMHLKEKMNEKRLTIYGTIEPSSVELTKTKNEYHIDIEKDINENIIDETEKEINIYKNEESIKKITNLKKYVNKKIDTRDSNFIYEIIKEKNKVATADKEINTDLINVTLSKLLKEDKKHNEKNDILSSIPTDSYPYYHYFYSNLNKNYFVNHNIKKKKICKEDLNKSDVLNIKCNIQHHSVNKNNDDNNDIFLENVLKNSILYYNENHKRINSNPEKLDENYMTLCDKIRKYFYDNDKAKHNCDYSLNESRNILENDNSLSVIPKIIRINENLSDVNKNDDYIDKKKIDNDEKCNISMDCCDPLSRLLNSKLNCYLCKTKNEYDSSDNPLNTNYKIKKVDTLQNNSSVNEKCKIFKMCRSDLNSNNESTKFNNENEGNYSVNVSTNCNINGADNDNCYSKKECEDDNINDNGNNNNSDNNNDSNNGNNNGSKKSKNMHKEENKNIGEYKHENANDDKCYNIYEKKEAVNTKKTLGHSRADFNTNKNYSINKVFNHEYDIILNRISSNKNINSKIINNMNTHSLLNNKRRITNTSKINKIHRIDNSIYQINNSNTESNKTHPYIYINPIDNLQENKKSHKRASYCNNICRNTLKISNEKDRIKADEKLGYDSLNRDKNIITNQTMIKTSNFKIADAKEKNALYKPYKKDKNNDNFSLEDDKNFIYHNSFNQYLDINKKSYETINKYLHNNFSYIT